MGLAPSSLRRAAKSLPPWKPDGSGIDWGNNPNPERFVVEEAIAYGRHCVAKIRYPDATNYEGVKVLLYLSTTPEEIRSAFRLDPHFSDGPTLSDEIIMTARRQSRAYVPFARFEPTKAGWLAAAFLAESLESRDA